MLRRKCVAGLYLALATLLLIFTVGPAVSQTPGSVPVAQRPKVMAPHSPVRPLLPHTGQWDKPAVPRSMVGGLWMIGANFNSSIYIKNGVEVSPVKVTPILYLSNGTKFTLPDITLEASGTAVISINDALANQGIAPWATLSGCGNRLYLALGPGLCNGDERRYCAQRHLYLRTAAIFSRPSRSSHASWFSDSARKICRRRHVVEAGT
jgi:hypothetical protein